MNRVTPLFYYVLGSLGLALIFVAQLRQGAETLNYLVIAIGAVAMLTRWSRAPAIFLAVLTTGQMITHERSWMFPSARPFEPTAMLLAAGALLFIGSLFRLHGLTRHVTPPDPRIDRRTPGVPQTRPVAALRAEEIAGWILSIPVFVLAGELLAEVLEQPTTLTVLFLPGFAKIVTVVWLLVISILVVGSVFSYLRRANADAETARMYLQETVWQETRGDLGRMGRWLAWSRRRRK